MNGQRQRRRRGGFAASKAWGVAALLGFDLFMASTDLPAQEPTAPTQAVGRPVLLPPLPSAGEARPPLTVQITRDELMLPPVLPPPVPTAPLETTPAPAKPAVKAVPISLDAVLHLAQDHNGMIRLAREKLQEAFIEQSLTHKRWLPDLSIGAGYWRHEGGIQDFQGNLVRSSYGSGLLGLELRGKVDLRDVVFQKLEAERRVWQRQGELSKFTSEQLLDAASTYVDLLAAKTGVAIALEIEEKLDRLLAQARNLEKVDPGVRVEVMRVEAELNAQRMLTRRVRQGASAATAKLSYLLGLDPDAELVPLDGQLVAFRLMDPQQPVATLLDAALQRGPGVQELIAVLNVVESLRAKSDSSLSLMPTIEVRMTEGAFGAGPGSRTDWDNRWELGLQARWNLTELLTKGERRRLGDNQIQQVHLSYQELRSKLTLGVQEAREAALSGQEQVQFATRQIDHAEESYRLSDMRLRDNIKGRSPSEVLLALRTLVGARLSYLNALRDQNKAQLRLFILTGGAPAAPVR